MDPQYVTDITKGAVATAMYFAKAQNHLSVLSEPLESIDDYFLYPPRPNPFNPVTEITYKINKPGLVEISLFSINGQKVSTILKGQKSIGRYTTTIDGTELSSGFYLVKMNINDFSASRKILLVK
jgi:hypothetical protein